MSVEELLSECTADYAKLEASELAHSSPEYQTAVRRCLFLHSVLLRGVESARLFSRNEELGDIKTADLPYFALELRLAVLLQRIVDAPFDAERAEARLTRAHDALTELLGRAQRYGLIAAAEAALWQASAAPDPHDVREVKVARAKRARAARQRAEQLRVLIAGGAAAAAAGETAEDLARELFLAELTCELARALDEVSSVRQELQLIAHRLALARAAPSAPGAAGLAAGIDPARLAADPDLAAAAEVLRAHAARQAAAAERASLPPLRAITLNRRDLERMAVFGSRNRYELTPEEWAEGLLAKGLVPSCVGPPRALADVRADEERAAAAAAAKAEADALGDESEAETMRLRAWDDWKDANPRGAGNTMSRLG